MAELSGVNSVINSKTPSSYNECRISRLSLANFCYKGNLNGKLCTFRIDTGSDVSIVNAKLAGDFDVYGAKKNLNLVYPTGESIPVRSEIVVKVELGRFSLDLPMYVAEMRDDCLLGVDFLSHTNLESAFQTALGIFQPVGKKVTCARITNITDQVPKELQSFFHQHSKELDVYQQKDFAHFVNEFEDIFCEIVIAGNCEVIEHKIELTNNQSIKQIPRRIPLSVRSEPDGLIKEMRMKGVIEESHSPWVSPVVLSRKKDGISRFCIDFRKLNDVTVKDSYPLPRIDDLLDQLSGNVWFSTIDLKSGYWQVKLRDEDKEKTAFSIGSGLWQFRVMLFGLSNAPATFERLMENVLSGLLSKICLVYLDDIIIFSPTFPHGMVENLREVFSRFRTANLKVNPAKCNFFSKSVTYLGHVISAEGITTDPEKISAVIDWPIPQTKKQVRGFLGFCSYYRRFVKGFSSIAKPLYALTDKQFKFSWNEQCQRSFQELKRVMTSSPVFSFPLEKGEFVLDTDASGFGIGAVLSQVQQGQEKVIAYFSRTLSKTERNYCVTRRELLAIVVSLKTFHHYLDDR